LVTDRIMSSGCVVVVVMVWLVPEVTVASVIASTGVVSLMPLYSSAA